MPKEYFWMVAALFIAMFAGMAYDSKTKSDVQIACIAAKGDYANGKCTFE